MLNKPDIVKLIFEHFRLPERTHLCRSLKSLSLLNTASKLNRLFHLRQTISGHNEAIQCLVVLPNGNIASGSTDTTIKIWCVKDNYKCLKVLTDHEDSIWSMIAFHDNNIASGSRDHTIRIWDYLSDYKCTHVLEGHLQPISNLDLLPNGNLISVSWDFRVCVWREGSYKYVDTNESIQCTSFIVLDSGNMASILGENFITIWNPLTFSIIYKFKAHQDDESILCLLRMGDNILASSSTDKSIKLWDGNNGYSIAQVLTGHEKGVNSIITLRDGNVLSASEDCTFRIWDCKRNYECSRVFKSHTGLIVSLILLPDDDFASSTETGEINIWSIGTN
jgi:WD40 repeat protein